MNPKPKPKKKRQPICRWCGEPYKLNYQNRFRKHCFKPECVKRQWLYKFLESYKRCLGKDCENILIRTRHPRLHTQNYCPFCVATKRSIREEYIEWLRSLPKYVEVLLPKRNIPVKNHKQYVKNYAINSLRFQVHYPNPQKQHY